MAHGYSAVLAETRNLSHFGKADLAEGLEVIHEQNPEDVPAGVPSYGKLL
jgi:hypothetical protein